MGPLPKISTTRKGNSGENSGAFSPTDLESEAQRLLEGAYAKNSLKSYETGLSAFEQFRTAQNINKYWPPNLDTIVEFIAYLSLKGLSANTAKSYVLAIGYKCKVLGFSDVNKNFVVQKMLEGMKRLKNKADTRLPISEIILSKIILRLPGTCSNIYETKLFKAAFTLAFWGLFRVGEITVAKRQSLNHIISVNDVYVDIKSGKLVVFVRHSKTDQMGKGVTIELRKNGTLICPFHSIHDYLLARPEKSGPLFCHFSGAPLTRYQFSAMLNKTLDYAGIDSKHFKCHSFRIGGATALSMAGRSIEEIKSMGRWKSSAYKSYIRAN